MPIRGLPVNELEYFVRCCSKTKQCNIIYYSEDPHGFYNISDDERWEFCPWCGTLLDTNLDISHRSEGVD